MEIKLIDAMGSDLTVVNAARVSFKKKSVKFKRKDLFLLRYLAKHRHWTPFSHCILQFHIKAPIFVARQLFKHKVGLTENEVSRRYVSDEPEFYVPHKWRGTAENIKQGSSDEIIDVDPYRVDAFLTHTKWLYNKLLEDGVAPEQARMILPQCTYTEWYWTGSLAAFARVCELRVAKDAQKETQIIANGIKRHCLEQFPLAADALMNKEEEE